MADIIKGIVLRESGHVEIRREIDGIIWRRAIDPQDEAALDQFVPEVTAQQKQAILNKWKTIPKPPPDPVKPQQTLRQQIANRLRADPVMRAQAIETRDRLGINSEQLLDLFEAKAAGSIGDGSVQPGRGRPV